MLSATLFSSLFKTRYGEGMHLSLFFVSVRGAVSGRAANPAVKISHVMAPPHAILVQLRIIYWSQFQGV